MLSMDASDLDIVISGDLVESLLVLHKLGELDVHGGSQGGTKVGWARSDVTEMVIMGELADFLNGCSSSAKSVEDSLDVGAWLHGNDSQLIFFIDPDKECLFIVVEDTSSGWPVLVQVGGSKIFVTLLEEEVIIDQLLLGLFVHSLEWVEGSLKISFEFTASFNDLVHNIESLLF